MLCADRVIIIIRVYSEESTMQKVAEVFDTFLWLSELPSITCHPVLSLLVYLHPPPPTHTSDQMLLRAGVLSDAPLCPQHPTHKVAQSRGSVDAMKT